MASICQVSTGPSILITSQITSTITNQQVITGDATTTTTQSPVVTSTCTTPIAIGNLTAPVESCSTFTSFVPVQTVIPGATRTTTLFTPTVIPTVIAEPGAVSTICSAAPTTAVTTTTSVAPTTTERTTTTRRVRTTTTTETTTTTTTPTSTTTTTTIAATPVAPVLVPITTTTTGPEVITSNGEPLTITSYSTYFLTLTDSSGRASVVTTSSGVPSLNSAGRGAASAKSRTGAIAGGVVGGILALLLAIFVVILLRKKGCFRHDDEHFNEDIWAPEPHGQGVVGIKARSVHPDEDDGDVGANSGEMMSEKEAGEGSVHDARRSWYGGMATSDHSHLSQRATSPTTNSYLAYDRADELSQDATVAAAARVRRSVSGMSSRGHGSHNSHHSMSQFGSGRPQSMVAPASVAHYQSRRMSQHEFYQQEEQQARSRSPTSPSAGDYEVYAARGGMYDRAMDQRREELEQMQRRGSHGANSTVSRRESFVSAHHSYSNPTSPIRGPTRHNSASASRKNSFSSSDHSTNAATTGSASGNSHGAGHLRPLTSLSPTTTMPISNYNKPYEFKRPQLEVITAINSSNNGASSSSSGALPSLLSANGHTSDSSSAESLRSPSPFSTFDPPRAAFLSADRPKFERTSSTSSFIPPSQFLGARVVNADD